MSNWFENNATKSVLGYTFIVAGSTWAVSTFVLQDNRLNLARSELEAQKSLTEQYRSKTELLQRDIDALRAENAEYRDWLAQTKDAIPVIVPRIIDLKQQITSLQNRPEMAGGSGALSVLPRNREGTAKLGTAYIDDVTGLIFAVHGTKPDRTARVSVKFPDGSTIAEKTIHSGEQWEFRHQDQKMLLTVRSISFAGDFVDLLIAPAK